MKTVTEFTRIEMKEAFRIRHGLLEDQRRKPKGPRPAAPQAASESAAPAADGAPATAPVETIESSAVAAEAAPAETAAPSEAPATETPPAESAPVAAATPPNPSPPAHHRRPKLPRLPDGRKDFSQAVIRSPEELFAERQEERRIALQAQLDEVKPTFLAALKEKFSWSDERAAHAFNAAEAVHPERIEDLRVIRVLKSDKEDEKLPPYARKVGEWILIAEYHPSRHAPREDDRGRGRGGRDDKRRGAKGGRGRGGPGQGRGEARGPRPPRGPGGPGGPGGGRPGSRPGGKPPAPKK